MEQLYLKTRKEWRGRLNQNHEKNSGIRLVFYRKPARKPTLEYEDAVEEALCFGWIDSIIKNLETGRSPEMVKKRKPPQNIDEYISGFPGEVQKILQKVRSTIKSAAPDSEEAMKYGIPTFVFNGNLVHFGAFKEHIGFYPTPSGIKKFKEELSAYESAKGSVKFPLDKSPPYGLIRRIVKYRVKESRNK
jgi:uncharacterized protein YdhG (YjbR/CyaY superfamily)